MNPQILSIVYDKVSPLINYLPKQRQIQLASYGRQQFMQHFVNYLQFKEYLPEPQQACELWGIKFQSQLGNAAGMFKNGDGYDVVAKLGAGAYLGGTSTFNPRVGNKKNSVKLPFIGLHKSQAAINWLGLPNRGDELLATQSITSNKIVGCPIGWSVMRSPDLPENEGVTKLIESLWRYHNHSQIDFIEINESCPNIKLGVAGIIPRLQRIASEFVAKRQRHLPVIVKLSNDLNPRDLAVILEELIRLKYDGITLGNTSTDYSSILSQITPAERKLFEYFTANFGGGVSGAPLKQKSLELCAEAANQLQRLQPSHEFHIIRSGGIETNQDLLASKQHGVSFNQWYTGFFNVYAKVGSAVYRSVLAD